MKLYLKYLALESAENLCGALIGAWLVGMASPRYGYWELFAHIFGILTVIALLWSAPRRMLQAKRLREIEYLEDSIKP